MIDFTNDLTINLKKCGPRLWQYENCEPTSVELAALDFFKDNGFSGYFSEREDYFCKFIVLLSWPIKRPWPRWLIGWESLFFGARDGIIKNHELSYSDIKQRILDFPPEEVESTIEKFISLKLKDTAWIGKGRSSGDYEKQHLLGFYNAVGNQGVADYLERRLSKDRHAAKTKLGKLNLPPLSDVAKLLKSYRRQIPMISLGAYAFFQGTDNCRNAYNDIMNEIVPKIEDEKLKRKLLNLLEFSKKHREITEYKRSSEAMLDLVLWDDKGIAYAEVKAPRDSLQKHQETWINTLRKNGERAATVWVKTL